ncbi:hypothetical protein [Paenibacillus sp. 481]|uniref:hypothetical protein n=1 Tax=Paenibacillus sp. 481 TaxID=2835869 RepID=UPI001E289801|nr:hypothetical protein [Paenibacillus sp. 481]UHA73109.1 hypothetical protein KIK04_21330 [Paenibacillus sp. 481]
MSNSIEKLVGVLLCILLLFIYPLMDFFQRQDDISSMYVFKSVTAFVDAARDKGFVTPQMYVDFTRELEQTGNMFHVQMEHYQKKYDPLYEDPNHASSFKNDFLVHHELVNTEGILLVMFPDSKEPMDALSRRYEMKAGDYFNVIVNNANRTKATVLHEFLTQSLSSNEKIVIPVGGMVRNEDY